MGEILVSLLLLQGSAAARTRLSYERAAGAERCPDAGALRSEVAARLGYDPFSEPAERIVSVVFTRGGTGLSASIALQSVAGAPLGERRLDAAGGNCRDLASAVALAIALAIDPAVLTRPRHPPPHPNPVAQAQVTVPPAEKAFRPRFALDLGTLGSVGAAPTVSGGVQAGVEARWGHYALGIEARADFPAGALLLGGQIQTELVTAALLPCFLISFLGICAVAAGGVQEVSGTGFQQSASPVTPWAAGGLRLRGEWPLWEQISLRAWLEGTVALARTTVYVGQDLAWMTPPLAGTLGLSAVYRLP
ncbi:MAG: hypothetical protein ACYDCL_06480 [Myxococcales bacterium]